MRDETTGRVYQFDAFLLNPADRVLSREGRVIPLTPKSFDLLVALVANSGHLVEKDALLKAVWPNQFVEESNLPFTISVLRKALADSHPNGARLIETVPKSGYRFTAPVRVVPQEPRLSAMADLVLDGHRPPKRPWWKAASIVAATATVVLATLVVLWRTRPEAAATLHPFELSPYSRSGSWMAR